ncbi:hypothetical protein Gasu2_10570 [Galdieria sulphuraria]|uniref:Uncharacterized protein n=1 Tax=Galdieria sulphuraria TaxID=130081 RepID=M2Y8E1_GALSU|nr:uncharacterized protein Gasu_08510 [Galdieria sulphuraria]EME32109.1 hypothetical protein Gasu_08510 [Galdieria sulphuraria]GJD06653.1 hypothetical protein Gasu2_10570 [Galdieria sulphuraria]|eukprot:XP_005708629.1 hypothetical protein Gasu_08510 [Galdieria sulphuraria]
MENSMARVLEQLANEPKVKGFLVADWEGLCIASRGVAPSQSSGWITSIAEASLMLRKDMKTENKEPPFIQVDLGKYVVAVRPLESVILAVYRESDGKQ